MNKRVHLVDIQCIYPESNAIEDIFSKVLPAKYQAFALKASRLLDINTKYSVLDFDRFPAMRISKDNFPEDWAAGLWSSMQQQYSLPSSEIGYFATAYNVSGHRQKLPNLSSQIAYASGMDLKVAPKQFYQYGCAGGMLALQEAVTFCEQNDRPALVFVFDQCSLEADFNGLTDANIKEKIKSYLLFADAGSMMLLMNEDTLNKYNMKQSLSIEAIDFMHSHLDELIMDEQGMALSKNVQQVIPQLIEKELLLPLLNQRNLQQQDISSWVFHTGGIPILNAIQAHLKLSEKDMQNSKATLRKFGNTSSASVFLTLHDLWQAREMSEQVAGGYGAAIAFGSGFYSGGFIFKRNQF